MLDPAPAFFSGILFLVASLPAQEVVQEASPPVTVSLRRQARVPGHEILLSDIARITSTDKDLERFLGRVPIGAAPKGSWARNVEAAEIRQALVARGLKAEDVHFEDIRATEVLAAAVQVQPEEIIRTAETVLRAMLIDQGEADAQWTVRARPRPVVVPIGRRGREVTASLPSGRLGSASATLKVEVKVDDRVVTSVPVNFQLQRFRDVLVVTKQLRRDDALDASSVATRRMDVAGLLQEPLLRPEQIDGRVAARNLRPGTVLTAGDLERPALILKDQPVLVVVKVGKVRISRKGIARMSGARGDSIPVQMEKRAQPILAEVYGPGLAVIEAGAVPASFRRPGR